MLCATISICLLLQNCWQPNFSHFMLRSRSRKFWKGRTSYLRIRNSIVSTKHITEELVRPYFYKLKARSLSNQKVLLSFQRVLLLSTASLRRYRSRCWVAIRLSHRPEPSGRVVRGEVIGLDSGGRHGRQLLLRHTHRPQRRPYPICTGRSGNVRHRCGGNWAGPRLFLGGSFRLRVYRCLELKCGVLWGCPPTPRSIDDPPTARTHQKSAHSPKKWFSLNKSPKPKTRVSLFLRESWQNVSF